MIIAKFGYSKSTGYISMTVKGHSGAAEVGQDIICASASIIAYTVAQMIKDANAHQKLKNQPIVTLRKGYSKISCIPKKEHFDEILHCFFMGQTGLNLLQHNYPQYVNLTMFG